MDQFALRSSAEDRLCWAYASLAAHEHLPTMKLPDSTARRASLALLVVGVGLKAAECFAGQQFRSDADFVRVEVVARDSAGRPLLGLTKEQFTVLEDGVRQEIRLFVEVSGRATDRHIAGLEPAPGVARHGTQVSDRDARRPDGPSLIALVVDQVTPEARAFLAKALTAFVEKNTIDAYVGIFSSENGLRTLQSFTRDRDALAAAVRAVSMTPSAPFGREHERNAQAGADAHPSVPVVASAESAGRPITLPGQSQDDAALAALGSSNSWEILARNQRGHASTDALLALAATLGTVEGRKSVVFFADRLAIPDAVLPYFNNVVATASRSQVSIYTVDTGGLRVHSTDAETGREVRAVGAAGLTTNDDGSSNSSLMLMERNEDVLRKDPRTSLTLLAERTGGAFTGSTNDLARGLSAVVEDHEFYYILAYAPQAARSAAGWRRLQVKVDRRRAILRHRQGYVSGVTSSRRP